MTPDDSILVDAALAGMCLLLVATFGLVWRLNERMGRVYSAVFDEPFGLVKMMEKMAAKLERMDNRVTALEHPE